MVSLLAPIAASPPSPAALFGSPLFDDPRFGSEQVSASLERAGSAPGWATFLGSAVGTYWLGARHSPFLRVSRPLAVAGALIGGLIASVGWSRFADEEDPNNPPGSLLANLILPVAVSLLFPRFLANIGGLPFNLLTRDPHRYTGYLYRSFGEIFRNDWAAMTQKWGAVFTRDFYLKPALPYSIIRIGGAIGLPANLFHEWFASKELKEDSTWQTVRMVLGVLMTFTVAEYTIHTMGLLRFGAYVSVLTEMIVEWGNQRKTTALWDLNYLRFAMGALRTGIFSMALDRGIYFTRLNRLARLAPEEFRTIYTKFPDAGTYAELAGTLPFETRLSLINGSLGRNLAERIVAMRRLAALETFPRRVSVALEAVVPTNLLMAPVYALEGVVQQVNPENYLIARSQQVLSPSPFMQIAGEYFGHYTRPESIFVNKFLLFWVLGNATYIMNPKYAGEDRSIRTFLQKIDAAEQADPRHGEEWANAVSFYLRKKMGHVEGDLISREGWWGYGRASKYSLSNDAQPFGVFFGSILEGVGLRGAANGIYRFADTLFTPDRNAMFTLFDSLRSPDRHRLDVAERDRLMATLERYVNRSPLFDPRASARLFAENRIRYWEEWALVRMLAVYAALSGPYLDFHPLQRNPRLIEMETTVEPYLRGTESRPLNERMDEAIRRLSRETIRRCYG